MWSDLNAVSTTIKHLKHILENQNVDYRIYAFSEGSCSDLDELEALGVKLFLGTDTFRTLREIIEADILVMAKSAFSYVAAIISAGIKLYEPCGYPPFKTWLVREPKGSFDECVFSMQLETMRQSLKTNSRG